MLLNNEAGLYDYFIVISVDKFRFLQFSSVPIGLQLLWPNGNQVLKSLYPKFESLILQKGYKKIQLMKLPLNLLKTFRKCPMLS